MQGIIDAILSPVWWFSGILGLLAALGINYISPYLNRRVDNQLSKTSQWWATRTASKKAASERRIQRLATSESMRVLVAIHTSSRMTTSGMLFLAGMGAGALSQILGELNRPGDYGGIVISGIHALASLLFIGLSVRSLIDATNRMR